MNYISKKFNIHYLPEYTLLVKAGFEKDVLAVVDKKQVSSVLIEYLSDNPVVDATQILSLPFRFVRIVIPQQTFTFIPKEVFEPSNLESYVRFLGSDELKSTFVYHLSNINVVAVYQFDKIIYNRWIKLYPDAIIIPDFAVVLEQAQDRIPIRGSFMGLHFISGKEVDLYLFNNGHFLLYNTFEIQNQDDINYFIISILSQFNLGNCFTKVLLSGDIPSEEIYRCVATYAVDIEILQPKVKVTLADLELHQSLDQYGVLFDALLCE